ncbi:F-type H+-transporting ATPase subunit gamma [Methylomagnum ishizawai]|uniref:F-type H+-transporting ATPase subunit gamma n=1 Tax=Methylomagnum ishizawai TaxID=1760988 RepID=A0A1Y6D4U6_9GAMM|nr:F0F1 ATP synthase subunit gamma [Methylomagnum ishizawai]SMF95883.1 F-type H+-transporting ATPase subunit gamma [Methylomagnum ishizawai]
MSRRAQVEEHMARLAEISGILAAMKTLASIETHKFARYMAQQAALVENIETAAADFLAFHPDFRDDATAADDARRLWLVIGSERGFCGDFNEAVAAALEASPEPGPRLLVVGRRLAGKLERHPRLVGWLDGPNTAEEVRPVLDRLLNQLHALRETPPAWTRLGVLAHAAEGGVVPHTVLPMQPPQSTRPAYPPRLNLDPAEFFAGLTGHYLAAKLPCLFHGSLLAENRRRLEHMERALHRMQAKLEDLGRARNALRQEEITEEIEMILLSAEARLGGIN